MERKANKRLIAGFKRTRQRLAILSYLEGNTAHPSAEDIFKAVVGKRRNLSIATVYNTLNSLAKAGAVRELTIDPERKRYDPDTSLHHHIICVNCRRVIDIPEKVAVDLPRTAARDFKILGSHVEFYGQCLSCRKKQRAG